MYPNRFLVWIPKQISSMDTQIDFQYGYPNRFLVGVPKQIFSMDTQIDFQYGYPNRFLVWISKQISSMDTQIDFQYGYPNRFLVLITKQICFSRIIRLHKISTARSYELGDGKFKWKPEYIKAMFLLFQGRAPTCRMTFPIHNSTLQIFD